MTTQKIKIKRGIRWRLLLTMVTLISIILATLVTIQISTQKKMLESELSSHIRFMKTNLTQRATVLSENLINQTENYIATYNFSHLSNIINTEVKNHTSELDYAILINTENLVFIHTKSPDDEQETVDTLADEHMKKAISTKKTIIHETQTNNKAILEIITPIQVSTEPWGILRLGFSLALLHQEIEKSQAEISQQIYNLILRALGIYILFIIVTTLLIAIISKKLSTPLITLTEVARELADGHFEMAAKITLKSDDEVGVLSQAFTDMSKKLKDSYEQLEDYSFSLEQKVKERTRELSQKNEALEQSLQQVKRMQNQIIVQEKMASLGALTAGIAHEIKNPLNFVNNFSELSIEFSEELEEEIEAIKSNITEDTYTDIIEITENISENCKKIKSHGQRADNIVRNMLLHSRQGGSQREKTNINNLLDESVNLAYHGMRASDSSFNTSFELSTDPLLPDINICKQDVGRVFLNIFNNAFYALNEKQKSCEMPDYKPTLMIKTFNQAADIKIQIHDNGMGIPNAIKEQIFNPFFTTKPAGAGTGLGLSLSYDIIVQQHWGQLNVNSTPGEYTEFEITFPKEVT